jgi:hypothetical protein
MLLIMVAHKKLLDLDTAGLPPRESNQKRICAGTSGKAGGLGIQKEPFAGIGGVANRSFHPFRSNGKQEAEYFSIGLAHFRPRVPLACNQILAVTVPADLSANGCECIASLVCVPLDGIRPAQRL